MFGTQKIHRQNLRGLYHRGTQCLPAAPCCSVAERSRAVSDYFCSHRFCHSDRLQGLEVYAGFRKMVDNSRKRSGQ